MKQIRPPAPEEVKPSAFSPPQEVTWPRSKGAAEHARKRRALIILEKNSIQSEARSGQIPAVFSSLLPSDPSRDPLAPPEPGPALGRLVDPCSGCPGGPGGAVNNGVFGVYDFSRRPRAWRLVHVCLDHTSVHVDPLIPDNPAFPLALSLIRAGRSF